MWWPVGRCLLCIVMLCSTLLTTATAATAWQVQRLGGRDYLPLSQVAAFYKMRLTPRGAGGVSLSSDDRRMDFGRGSREARIDGVKHWLSFPMIYYAGQFFISRMDLSKTIDPVMRPGRIPNLQPLHTVVIDPGHGGHDRGAVNRYGFEKNYALDLSRRIRPYLQAAGYRVVITRSRDQFIPLESRPAIASRLGDGTIFVSIHFNSAGQTSSRATGFEVFTMTPRGAPNSHDDFVTRRSFSSEQGHRMDHASQILATSIHHAMLGRVPMFDRGIKRARFAVLRRATTPAVLVENGFMSNPQEARKIHSAAWRDRLAESIAMGITSYGRLTRERTPPRLLASYRAEGGPMPAGSEFEYQPLAGIGASVQVGIPHARGWRGLLPAPLREEMPPFRLEFEPSGWVQLEILFASGEDARSMAANEQATIMNQGEWPEPIPAFPGLSGWRTLLPPHGLDSGFVLFPPADGPLAEGAGYGEPEAPEEAEVSGDAL